MLRCFRLAIGRGYPLRFAPCPAPDPAGAAPILHRRRPGDEPDLTRKKTVVC